MTHEEKNTLESLRRIRTKLVLSKNPRDVFFAHLAMHLKLGVDSSRPTAYTDGRGIYANPKFWDSLSEGEKMAVFAHELLHVAFRHHLRRGSRDPRKWNYACDLAINSILEEAGFELPENCLFPDDYEMDRNLSAEEYYSLLGEDAGQGSEQPSCGEVGDSPEEGNGGVGRHGGHSEEDNNNTASGGNDSGKDAKGEGGDGLTSEKAVARAVAAAAAAAKQRGDIPAALAAAIAELGEPKVDWRAVLANFLCSVRGTTEYDWRRPNRRFSDIYLPSLQPEECGTVVVAIDSSGSIISHAHRLLSEVIGVVQGVTPSMRVVILVCDADVHRAYEWGVDITEVKQIQVVGGGGTSHRPVWQWIDNNEHDVRVAICLTDGETDFGDEPAYPVVWAVYRPEGFGPLESVPFGHLINVED